MADNYLISRVGIFIVLSIPLIISSWRSLHNPRHHGFYRFFAFEGILIIILINAPYWIGNSYTPLQALSDILLLISILFVLTGLVQLKLMGGSRKINQGPENYGFENTRYLVNKGLYKYTRHPMYSSLLLLTWGALFKHVSVYSLGVALATSLVIYIAAKTEEKENYLFFGDAYKSYMDKTKMFVPFIY